MNTPTHIPTKFTRNDYIKSQTEVETQRLLTEGGKVVTVKDQNGKVVETNATGLPRKLAKKIARQRVLDSLSYNIGQLGASEFAKEPSRKERRRLAKQNKTGFTAMYNGEKPKSFKEFFGVGYERFDNKYIKVSELV